MDDMQQPLDTHSPEMNDLRMSDAARPLYEHVKAFIKDVVNPMSEEFHRLKAKPTRGAITRASWKHLKRQKTKQRNKASGTSSFPTRILAKASKTSTMRISQLNLAKTRSHPRQ